MIKTQEKMVPTENEKVKITIVPKFCKGCDICVRLCPKSVLGMEMFKVNVVDINKCIICGQCELRCPDFAIFVEKKEVEKKEVEKKEATGGESG